MIEYTVFRPKKAPHTFLFLSLSLSLSLFLTIEYKIYLYLPTPPLGQDMTQGRVFKRSLTGLNSEFSFS